MAPAVHQLSGGLHSAPAIEAKTTFIHEIAVGGLVVELWPHKF